MKKILFLGYDEKQTRLINELIMAGHKVDHTKEKLKPSINLADYDRVISFGYRHILPEKIIASSHTDIINLHTSYLPYNKGAHPYFWAFHDDTPHGVTIHRIDKGIDTGPILFQKIVTHTQEVTFSEMRKTLICELETLFIDNIDTILNQSLKGHSQQEEGTFHKLSDLPYIEGGMEAEIIPTLARLDRRNTKDNKSVHKNKS